MHDQRQARAGFHDLLNAVEGQLGFVLEFESPMAGADGDGQAVDPGALRRNRRPAGIGKELLEVLVIFFGIQADDVFLDAAKHAQFGFDHHAGGMGGLDTSAVNLSSLRRGGASRRSSREV